MAGMLPGVEFARKRGFRRSSGWSDLQNHSGTRRSSLCLYPSNHETHQSSTSSMGRRVCDQAYLDEDLSEAAREAKERLDEKLRPQRAGNKRNNTKHSLRCAEDSSKKFGWTNFSWKAADQDKCTTCIVDLKYNSWSIF